jgi:diaminopimelate epimerase
LGYYFAPVLITFSKYQGTGNDFIMIDNRDGSIRLSKEQVIQLCDRKFGIGSDGIVLIESHAIEDFYMNFYNPDGSQSFCGNGSRCAVAFARQLGIVGNHGLFGAIDKSHAFVVNDGEIAIQMRDVDAVTWTDEQCIIQTGSPHLIQLTNDPEKLDVAVEGASIRYSERFSKDGINVNFVHMGKGELWMRTYERGVEAETLSCGTGVTAAALSLAALQPDVREVHVHTRGGDLKVKLERTSDGGFHDVWLCGPAKSVFQGTIEL